MNKTLDLKNLGTLFKYISCSDEIITGIFENNEIRITQPAALNDPLEFNPSIRFSSCESNYNKYLYDEVIMPSVHDWYQFNIIERQINNYGVLSLTDNPFSFDMWSHYANGHNGLLFGFKVDDKSKPDITLSPLKTYRAHKVKYVNDYSINIDHLEKNKRPIPYHKLRDTIFLRKTKHWKKEREYRIVMGMENCNKWSPSKTRKSHRDKQVYLHPIDLNCVNSITFGVNTELKHKEKIITLCEKHNIEFLQTLIYKDKNNEINYIPISEFGTLSHFLSLRPQTFTADSLMADYRNKIMINSLDKLPYYHTQPNDYDAYYAKRKSKI